ncbi:hypothetical protein EJ05DRAFT_497984 [Pseudovirgaria hyperparasitica]|uniref:Uncharacterized protein n=1 Tax=Pseudovirgaria hyperparasitica TaxID=470096 RepID=A0A6A6WFC9_9PEZI|nr:uncharacterized protein EJ05DRAFT_497984 [Pseudovirgaria hyperparasitica]KAF2761433.1 hypothetical protein EJ05DRAFT_497984 [Pseudovirgaria hyperparasitica]
MPSKGSVNAFVCGHVDRRTSRLGNCTIRAIHRFPCPKCSRSNPATHPRPTAPVSRHRHRLPNDIYRTSLPSISKALRRHLTNLSTSLTSLSPPHAKHDIYALPESHLDAHRAVSALEHWSLDYANPTMPLPPHTHIQATILKATDCIADLELELSERFRERSNRALAAQVRNVVRAVLASRLQAPGSAPVEYNYNAQTALRRRVFASSTARGVGTDATAYAYGASRYAQAGPARSSSYPCFSPSPSPPVGAGAACTYPYTGTYTHRPQSGDDMHDPPPPYSRYDPMRRGGA